MRSLLLFLLPFFLFAKPFKVASYNVENLFDAVSNGSEYETYQSKNNWTARMVEIKLNHTAEVICDLDAEILGLQEIENDTILMQLQAKLESVGCEYPYSAITHKKDAPIQVALLSRFPIAKVEEIEVSRSSLVRNILEAEIQIETKKISIFVNHWKSRAYGGWESKRMAYASALKKDLDTLAKGKEYILLGDFNTDYDANLALETKIDDTKGKTGLHHLLGLSRDENQLLHHLKEPLHYTLWQELQIEHRWNTKFYGKRGTPDHILLPHTLFDGQGIEYVNDSFGVFKRSYLFTKQGYINRWEYKNGKHRGSGYSDHLPVFAFFDTKPYQKGRSNDSVQSQIRDIAYLYRQESLNHDVILKDVAVVWKQGHHALIKESPQNQGIFLYGCAGELKAGKRYDLLVRNIKSYHGLKEITHAYKLKEKGSVDTESYCIDSSRFTNMESLKQNECIRNIVGIYKGGDFYAQGIKIPIYFKKQKSAPQEGRKLKIGYAHVGYYKKLQLVVYDPKDFKILE